jgi:transposase
MQNQQRKLPSSDADYRPPSCPNCSKLTSLTIRSPDYNVRYLRYERQVFTCPACGQQTERIVDIDGNVPGYSVQ